MVTVFRIVLFIVGATLLTIAAGDLIESGQAERWSKWVTIALLASLGGMLAAVAIFWRRFSGMVLRQIAPDKVFNGPAGG